jgi:hypothetical protein
MRYPRFIPSPTKPPRLVAKIDRHFGPSRGIGGAYSFAHESLSYPIFADSYLIFCTQTVRQSVRSIHSGLIAHRTYPGANALREPNVMTFAPVDHR